MRINYIKRLNGTLLTALVFALAIVAQPVHAAASPMFNSIPSPIPPSSSSLGYEAQQTGEFGAHIQFAAGERQFGTVNVVMNSWACETGIVEQGNCVTTTPGKTFQHPITLNIYSVAHDGSRGSEITSTTKTFDIPYRPSPDTTGFCSLPGQWKSAIDTCHFGYNHLISFNLEGATLPNQVIYGIEYNTSTSGYTPLVANGPYDALNVSLVTPEQVNTGTHIQTFQSTNTSPDFQANPARSSNVAAVEFNVLTSPMNKEQCKNNGWASYGNTYKNQGQCVSSVANKK